MDFFDQLSELNRPTVHRKPWMDTVNLILATVDDLDRIADECIASKIYGLDIECTGLDARVFPQDNGTRTTNDKITGVCIAPNEHTSYYLPIRHKDDGADANIPPRLVRDMLLKIQASGAVSVFHNGKFDIEFLEFDPAGSFGNWDEPGTWEDTFVLAYLNNSRDKRRGLKHIAKTLLDREMIELEELFPSEVKHRDFSTLDPKWQPTVWYAASDALNTLALFKILHPQVVQKDAHGLSQATVYKIEKLCVTATRWMERCRVPMDRETIVKLIKLGQREWFESLAELYSGVNDILGRDARPGWFKAMQGVHHRVNAPFDPDCMEPSYMEHREQVLRDLGPSPISTLPKSVPSLTDPKVRETVEFPSVYDVTIPAELGLLLRELGVEGLTATEKSGQVKTSKDELNRIVDEMGDDLPFAPRIKRFREVAKGLSSNLFPVYHDLAPENSPDGRLWVGFNGMRADTGRFATPTSEEREFNGQSRWNLHSIPATYDKTKPECVRKMRTSVKARKGKLLFAIDYSGVELRIVTNLSGEPKWITEFFRCSNCDTRFDTGKRPPPFCPNCWSDKIGDLHTLTALAIYGENAAESSDFKQKRQSSKCVHTRTLVRTSNGYRRIGDLAQLGEVDTFAPVPDGCEVLGPDGYVPVREIYNGGVKPLYHVVTRRGVLTCSGEHRFALADGGLLSVNSGLGPGMVLPEPVFVPNAVRGRFGTLRTNDLFEAGAIAEMARADGIRVSLSLNPGGVVCIDDLPDAQANEVLFIYPAGEHPCVDLHVESEDHLYAANGLVTHNSLNFAMCYGGGGTAAQRAVGVDKEEGWRIKRQFDKSYKGLSKWWESQHLTARKQKYVTTVFGRKYPLPDIDHPDGGFRSKAERNATNGPVQGGSADIMKFAMGLIYRELKARGWLDRVLMCITIHDELVFEIDEDIAEEAVYLINEIMAERTVKNLGWVIPLRNDIEFGDDWTVPFNLIGLTNPKETKPEAWTERWQRVFPKTYAEYLANGGAGTKPPESESVTPTNPIPTAKPLTQERLWTESTGGGEFTYRIRRVRLTPQVAEALARVIHRYRDRGGDTVYVKTDDDVDLLGQPFKASFGEFRVIAEYEGL
jgi:DNA polymerase I-like protein with 3'-5' exonuclease and polymerase domains